MDALNSSSSLQLHSRPANATGGPWAVAAGCEQRPAGALFNLSLRVIVVIVGLPANVIVLWLLLRKRGISSSTDVFIFHLAFLDTFFTFLLPLRLVNVFVLNNNKSIWHAQEFAYGVKDMGGPLLLCCICLDRYMAVLHPIMFSSFKDQKYRAVFTATVLAVTVAYALAKTIGGILNFDKIFTVMILSAFTFMVFCNLSILWALRRSGPGRDEMHPMKKKAFRVVLSILGILVFNYLPPVALFPFQGYFSADVFICYVQDVAFSFYNISSSTQPLLYLSGVRKLPCLSSSICKLCCTADTPGQ
ncbi:uracil nucleotide/cysteinyl leukotriene receptor-like [Lepisosteus oculatus]|uniref:uracil nucleotide/cysteinyl leukotriene receptor-like n=1 Tax=Lepisosteus oculatus TaxID=7918 RepID=UPI0035F527AA